MSLNDWLSPANCPPVISTLDLNKMKRLLANGLLSLAVVLSAHAEPSETLSRLEASNAERGARATLRNIWNTVQFGEVLTGIASGDERWFELGLKFRGASDAGVTSMLNEAFGLALVTAPSRVLAAISEVRLAFSVDAVCKSPFIDEPHMGYAAYFDLAEKAVGQIQESRLYAIRDECLRALREGRILYLSRPYSSLNRTRGAAAPLAG